mgnify:CR=1 FL=1
MTDREINVLVIRTPRVTEDIGACMEHIRQGLREGALILGADIKYSVEKFPPLGYAAVEDARGKVVFDLRRGEITEAGGGSGPVTVEEPSRGGGAEDAPLPAKATTAPSVPMDKPRIVLPAAPVSIQNMKPVTVTPPLKVRGKDAAEKKEIFARLMAFKQENLTDWAQTLAKVGSESVTTEVLRNIVCSHMAVKLDVWREIGKALDLAQEVVSGSVESV